MTSNPTNPPTGMPREEAIADLMRRATVFIVSRGPSESGDLVAELRQMIKHLLPSEKRLEAGEIGKILAELDELSQKASIGPFHYCRHADDDATILAGDGDRLRKIDAKFLVALENAWPKLRDALIASSLSPAAGESRAIFDPDCDDLRDLVAAIPQPTDEQVKVGVLAIDEYYNGTKDAPVEGSVALCYRAMRALESPAAASRMDRVFTAATRYSRCCDQWQDGLGGMHCAECGKKTFAMLREVQGILEIGKSGAPISTATPIPAGE